MAEVAAADPQRPILHPYREPYLSNTGAELPLRFARADGVARVNAAWEESIYDSQTYGYRNCTRAASKLISPITGRHARAKIRRRPDEFSVIVTAPDYETTGCSQWAKESLTVAVRGRGQRGTLGLGNPCGAFKPPVTSSGVTDGYIFELGSDLDRIHLVPGGSRPAVRSFRYTVRLGARLISHGRLWLRVRRGPSHDIYEGSDDFVNVCINETYEIRSRGGRLYCHIPGRVSRRIFYGRRPKS